MTLLVLPLGMIFFPEAMISPSIDVLGKTAKETNAIVNFYVYRCISQSFCQPSVDDVLKKNRAKGRDFSKNFENLVHVI